MNDRIVVYVKVTLCKGEVIRATNCAICNAPLLRCKLKSVVTRITTHLKHCHATKVCCCKLKTIMLIKVVASSTCCNMLLQLATTKLVA